MSNKQHSGWTETEKRLVLRLSKTMSASEIAAKLKKLGYQAHSKDAVRGILRRYNERRDTVSSTPSFPMSKPAVARSTPARIMYFDIEASDLSAGFGEMLSFGWWWHDEPEPHVINIYDYEGWDKLPVEQRDLYLVKDVVKLIEAADVIIGHYSTKFDTPFIQTRALFHNLGPIPIPIQIDTWRIARYQLKLNNNRLKTVALAFGCDEQKGEVPMNIWRRAKAHDLEALKMISEYNVQDVRTQRSITEKLMPLAKGMPNWNLLTDQSQPRCPACGSTSLQHRGFALTKLYKYKRLRCNECGKWMRDRNSVTPKDTNRVMH